MIFQFLKSSYKKLTDILSRAGARLGSKIRALFGAGLNEETLEQLEKLFYEADFDLPAEGDWRVEVQVDGPAGAGSTSFDVDALPPSTLNNLLGLGWPLWAGLGLALLTTGWWFTMARDRNNEVRHA